MYTSRIYVTLNISLQVYSDWQIQPRFNTYYLQSTYKYYKPVILTLVLTSSRNMDYLLKCSQLREKLNVNHNKPTERFMSRVVINFIHGNNNLDRLSELFTTEGLHEPHTNPPYSTNPQQK